MGITKFLTEVKEDYEILGERKGDWEVFKIKIVYNGFFVITLYNKLY
jgi:hypothetical protein